MCCITIKIKTLCSSSVLPEAQNQVLDRTILIWNSFKIQWFLRKPLWSNILHCTAAYSSKQRKMFVSRNQRRSLNKPARGENLLALLAIFLSSSFILCHYIWLPRSSMTNVFSLSSSFLSGRTFSDHMNRTRILNRGQRYHRQAAGTEKDS